MTSALPNRGRAKAASSDEGATTPAGVLPTRNDATVNIRAKARILAWCRILDALAEQREALEYRIWCEDPDDTHLEADCRLWCELAQALADFPNARRSE
jgi:hypothetical protein